MTSRVAADDTPTREPSGRRRWRVGSRRPTAARCRSGRRKPRRRRQAAPAAATRREAEPEPVVVARDRRRSHRARSWSAPGGSAGEAPDRAARRPRQLPDDTAAVPAPPSRDAHRHDHTARAASSMKIEARSRRSRPGNFVALASCGYYDGRRVPPVVPASSSRAATASTDRSADDPSRDGSGGPGYTIQDEPVDGQRTSGARSRWHDGPGPNTQGSQFFIVL